MGNYTRREYHTQHPTWRSGFRKEGKYIGIELECISNSGGYRTLLDRLPNFPFGRGPLAEDDGSLPPTRGVELIFPPVSYMQLKKPTSAFAKSLASLRGYLDDDDDEYDSVGMHMNVNAQSWSLEKKQIFSATIHHIKPEALERIGGRELNDYCYQQPYFPLDHYGSMDGHCFCSEAKGNRIELRFPNSTTDHSRVVQLTEFIEVLDNFSSKYDGKLPNTTKIWGDLDMWEYQGDLDEDEEAFDTGELEGMFKKYCAKTIKGQRVLGYLYNEKAISKNSNSSAEPAQPVRRRAA